ncbi:MAG: glycoside hydrolase family 9 protein [Bacteroidia bacterium]|nr:glycoside hydrolase family 9 protein [Bacteroidia bacterium]
MRKDQPLRNLVITPAAVLFSAIFILISCNKCFSQENSLKLNEKDYFEMQGFNVLVFENQYNGMFFDEKTAGILLIHNGVRTATGGAVRLKPTPEQWDQIPVVTERKVNKEDNSIDVTLRYAEFDFISHVKVKPQGSSVMITVTLDKPLPEKLAGRAGFNIEFLPTEYFGKTYLMDGISGLFPLYPASSMDVRPATTQITQFAGHSTFDGHGRAEYVEPKPIAEGKSLILAPEDPERKIRIQTATGSLMLLDGRAVAQNGWFVVRTLIPSNQTGKVIEWTITPNTIPDWIRPPVIAHSQVGYYPDQEKIAVIELDKNDKPLQNASVLKLTDTGEWIEKFSGEVKSWGIYLRYNYARFDFSAVKEPGIYVIKYGNQKTDPFQIGTQVYDNAWQQTLDVWFPVQMDHMYVNEAYRVWHGAAHLDDALQAPINHQHFDDFRMGDTTETKYKPLERIPGMNVGGWFDAGDYDLRTGSHCITISNLVDAFEHFGIKRDETLVDQKQRFVDIHHPDGQPDILQQIEHGTLNLIAQQRAFGRAITTIIEPNLHQYHHLGDAVNITDNLNYNPKLKPYESDGVSSGTPDDRWVFTNRSSRANYSSLVALAGASRALGSYNKSLSDECLATAKKVWTDEHNQPAGANAQGGGFGGSGEMEAALQLYICTKESQYADRFKELLWPSMERGFMMNMKLAVTAVPYIDNAYKEKLKPYVEKFKTANDALLKQNPFGVSISTGGWGGNEGIISWAITNYLLHKSFPEIIGQEYTQRGMAYIFGCHPYSDISFVSGVGTRSKEVAYGNNRADFTFIAGGVVPGILVLKPDFPEHMEKWPFLWGENEYVINICAEYVYLVNAVIDLKKEEK